MSEPKKPLEPMQFTEEQRNKTSFGVHFTGRPKSYFGIFVRIFATIFFLFPVLLTATIYHGFGKLLGVVSQGPPAPGDLCVSIFWSEDKDKSFKGPQFNMYDIFFLFILNLVGMVNIFPASSFPDSLMHRFGCYLHF